VFLGHDAQLPGRRVHDNSDRYARQRLQLKLVIVAYVVSLEVGFPVFPLDVEDSVYDESICFNS
jgi:hypothetical protein